jgi:hypothetical protein
MPGNNFPFLSGGQVVAYLRDSGGETQELSIIQHENEVRTWCNQHDLMLKHIYIDAARRGRRA